MSQHYTPEYEAGETIAIRTPALDPFKKNKTTVLGLTGAVQAFAPGKDPKNVPIDRDSPEATATFEYIDGQGYVAYLDTAGLTPAGVWTLRVNLFDPNGGYGNVEYANFELRL